MKKKFQNIFKKKEKNLNFFFKVPEFWYGRGKILVKKTPSSMKKKFNFFFQIKKENKLM